MKIENRAKNWTVCGFTWAVLFIYETSVSKTSTSDCVNKVTLQKRKTNGIIIILIAL